MSMPMIVLSPQAMPMEEPFRSHYHLTNAFNLSAVVRAGGIPVLPPYLGEAAARELMERADGLMLTGGADLSPALYGEAPLPQCGAIQPERDASDLLLLRTALALRRPVLCICRGCQLANVFFGGTLYQDLPAQYPGALAHSDYPGYACPSAHAVDLLPDTPLAALLAESRIGVNSLHHQAIRTLAGVLRPMARSEDGVTEAWYHPGLPFCWGLQWHPEMLDGDPRSDAIFRAFLDACRR